MNIPVVTIIGKSGSGKTTFLELLIAEIKRRGYRVGTVKHHSHSGFEIDKPGKDSWRHAQAGSDYVVIAAPDKIAAYRSLERELELDEVLEQIEGVDIILVEGYRAAGKPTIGVAGLGNGEEFHELRDQLIGMLTVNPLDLGVPEFKRGDAKGVADLIEAKFLNPETAGAQEQLQAAAC